MSNPTAARGVTIRGEKFPSLRAAGDRYGMSHVAVWRYVKAGRADEIGLNPVQDSGVAKPIAVRGHVYPSRTAAAKALGVTVSAVTKAEMRGALDSLGLMN